MEKATGQSAVLELRGFWEKVLGRKMQSCLERICIGSVDKRGGQQSRKFMHKQEEEAGDRQLGCSLSIILETATWKVMQCQYTLRNGSSLLLVLPSSFN